MLHLIVSYSPPARGITRPPLGERLHQRDRRQRRVDDGKVAGNR
jgi:hypothetical protein